MNKIMEDWEKNPIPPAIKDNPQNRLMTTIQGINDQISALQQGTGIIMVAVMDEANPGEIRTETILVNKE